MVSLVSLNRIDIHHIEARAIIIYIILLTIEFCEPNNQATTSKLSKPTEPQFNPPIMVSVKAILSIMLFSPLLNLLEQNFLILSLLKFSLFVS